MLKVLILFCVIANAFAVNEYSLKDSPVIQTEGGAVQGVRLSSGILSRYYAFKAIPYAEPPVGNLRFRAPIPHRGWDGIRSGKKHGSSCPSPAVIGNGVSGQEDCLFVNVYTPNLTENLSVMVFIHGGGFFIGSGDSFIYGPDNLVNENVIVVTLNYRLGILGFLSTGDKYAPGNYGMKDMILALKWIKNNIEKFGGNPNDITIFGESAGGAAVHYLVLSPMAKGLFNKAISQSGSALNPWALATDPKKWATHASNSLNLTTKDTEDLVNQLREVNVKNLMDITISWFALQIPRGFHPSPYAPCIDAPDSEEEIFLPKSPREIMESGQFNDVPYMTGYNSGESLFMIRESLLDSNTFPTLNKLPYFTIPFHWNIDIPSIAADTIANEFKQFYFNGKNLSSETRMEYSKFATDMHFIFGIDETVHYHSKSQSEPVYYYMFSFDGDLNLIKRLLLLSSYPGAVHADDVAYLFKITDLPPPLLPGNAAFQVRRRLVRMWTNFAKFGNPTPVLDNDITEFWPRVTTEQEHLNIGRELVSGTNLNGDRMSLWNSLRDRFAK